MTSHKTLPRYDLAIIEGLVLEMAAEMHSEYLSAEAFSLHIVCDPNDSREIATVVQAIRGLREAGLLKNRNDGIVEPTLAGRRAYGLLAQ